jgi:NAD(P)-dependent dehydrogenase (short-subunit alcohol dehydrogenase family)
MGERLKGKVAVVTGAASGIGAETARRMAAEGAAVVLGDLNERGLERVAAETGGIAVRTDVTQEDQVRALVDAALTGHGRIDVLHNNAVGNLPEDGSTISTPDEVWRATFDVVIMAAAYACRAAIPAMIDQGGGAIVNTSSGASATASGRIAYGVCKGALETFTLYTAGQFGPQGIRCNAVAPGAVLTEGMRAIFTPQRLEQFGAGSAAGRIAMPRDIADVVVFLASDAAAYVSGQTITINGGGGRVMQW